MRKVLLLFFVVAASWAFTLQNKKEDRKILLCRTWRQVAFKGRTDSVVKMIDTAYGKVMTFKPDGNYEERLTASKGKGQWRFNENQTKLGYTFSEFNGINLNNTDTAIETNIVILKLTPDTLIYGTEGLYGGLAKNDHDDWYFVRVK